MSIADIIIIIVISIIMLSILFFFFIYPRFIKHRSRCESCSTGKKFKKAFKDYKKNK